MAIRIPKLKILEDITNYVPSPFVEDAVDIAGKVYRAKILYDRNYRGFEKDVRERAPGQYEFEQTSNKRPQLKEYQNEILTNRRGRTQDIPRDAYNSELAGQRTARNLDKDSVSIIDIDYVPEKHDASRYYSYLKLPFIPDNLSYNISSTFVGIASFGRNNPYYHYAGSEDSLSFTIDWFSLKNSREDVIFYCRWLEALTKADAYDETPHRIKLSWGNDNLLFDNSTWIVESASYELSQFINAYRKDDIVTKVGLLPQQAFQKVVLKRITESNLTSSEIIGNIIPTLN